MGADFIKKKTQTNANTQTHTNAHISKHNKVTTALNNNVDIYIGKI